MSENTKWRIELLGGLRVQKAGGWISKFRTRRAGLLLARLALAGAPVARDDLVEFLWPDCSFEAGRSRLSDALSSLRRDLETASNPAKLFVGNHDFLGLNTRFVACDVHEFEELLKRAPDEPDEASRARVLRAAVELWRGPLWNSDDFEWLRAQAHRVNELLCGAALSLSELDAGQGLAALRCAHQVVPAREDVARGLMSALVAQGHVEEARRVWRSLETTLRAEWSRAPASSTRALAVQLLEGRPLQIAGMPARIERLPPRANRFFGRETELETLSNWLSRGCSARLILIAGGAGHGKTRLSLEAARQSADAFDGEVCFVPLAGQSDARRVLESVGDALRASRIPGQSDFDRVTRFLGTRRVLLLLDNFEHLASAAPEVERLLHVAQNAVCLLTSRHLLDLAGEHTLVLSPLPLPVGVSAAKTPGKKLRPHEQASGARFLEEWAHNPAMRLFADRAHAAMPSFRLHTGNAGAIARLCHTLGGVPLALELAAARTVALSPAQIEEHLQERLDVLERAAPDKGVQQGGLRAALDWSFELLSPAERRLFCRLSVFRGNWTLARAVAVCAVSSRENEVSIWKGHEELRRHCLLEAFDSDSGDELRFGFGETVRLYARERASVGGKRGVVEERHAHEFARFARGAARGGRGQNAGTWVRDLERELPDVRAALDWSLEHDGALALELAASLWWFWFSTARFDEGRAGLKRALSAQNSSIGSVLKIEGPAETGKETPANRLEASAENINWRAEAQSGAGFLAWRQGDLPEAMRLCSEASELARACGDGRALSYALIVLQMAALVGGDFDSARRMGDECLFLAREAADQHAEAFALHLLGSGAEMTGDPAAAWSLQEQSVALFEVTGGREGEAWALFNAGSAARRCGDFARALDLCARSRALFEAIGSSEGLGYCALHAALAHRDAGNLQAASTLLSASLKGLWELGALWGVSLALEAMAMTRFDGTQARAVESTRSWSAARHLHARIGAPVPPVDQSAFAVFEGELRAALPAPLFDAAWETGRALSLEQSVSAALQHAVE